MTSAVFILIIHILALALWAADSRALEYIIKRFNFRRSMPKPKELDDDNPFVVDSPTKVIDDKFKELIQSAYKGVPARWDAWGPDVRQYGSKEQKGNNFYKTDRPLESLFDSLMEELEKTEPEIYKVVLRRHFLRTRRRKEKEEDF